MSNTILVNKVLEPITARYLNGDCMLDEYGEAVKAFIVQYSQNLGQMLFSSSMNKLVTYALDLLNHHETKDIVKHKLAGLIIFDCLIDINDEIIPERRIEISNHIFKVLENDKLSLIVNEVILRTASSSIGHFARVASSSEAEFLQNFSFPLALKLLRDTKSDSHKFSGALILTQLAQNSPTLIFSKQRQVFAEICEIMSDKSPMVRSAAATALESVLRVIAQRESMSEYIKSAFKQVDSGLSAATQERIIGALCILDTILDGSVLTMGEVINAMRQYSIHPQDLIWKVLMRKDSKDLDVRRKVLEIIPNLARSFGNTFLQSNNYLTPPNNFLSYTTKFLIDQILEKKERVAAFLALTKLHSALSNHFRTALNVSDVFNAVCFGLRDAFTVEALECLGVLVSISPAFRKLVDQSLTSSMFRGGLSVQLVESLKLVTKHVPAVRNHALALVLREISGILVSNRMVSTEEQRKRQADGWVKSNKEKQKWNSGSNHRFQGTKPDAVVIDFIPSSDEIIFALRVLSESEFFPKYYREKSQGISEDDHTCTLLFLLRDSVIWYFDDPNILVRKAAATACSVVLNAIVLFVDRNSYEFLLMFHIVERLLTMGVGDDSQEIRCLVFSSFTPVLDEVLSKVGNVHCLIEGLNDEGLSVRTSAMTVLSRIARFNTLRIMPVIRLELKRLVGTLNTTQDHSVKQESVRILQALVKGSDFLIVPYVEQIIGPLLTLLNDSSPEVVAASLSTVGELALASPKSVTGHLDSLAPRVIEALNDQTSVIKQETAVIAMGKLVSSFSMVTAEPYKKYNGLFEGLVRAAQNSESLELRLQAIKTLGLLGVVDGNVYLSHLVCLNPARSAFNASSNLELFRTDFGQIEESDDEIMPEDISEYGKDQKLSQVERLYFTLIVTELMNILKESSLAYYHLSAAGVAVKTIRMLGSQSAFRVDTIVEGIFYRLMQQDAGNNIKEALLDHVITLIGALGSKMKRHNHQIVNLIKEFFDSHTQLCLDIFEALAIVYSTPDFCSVAQILFPFFAKSIEAELTFFAPTSEESSTYSETTLSANNTKVPTSIVKAGNSVGRTLNMEKISKYLQNLVNINEFLGDFRKDVYPTILMVLENPNLSVELRRDAILCIMSLVTDHDLLEIAGRVIRPLLKLLSGGDSRTQFLVMSTLCYIVCRLGTGFLPYIVLVNRKLASLSSGKDATNGKIHKCDEYDSLISRLFKQRSLPVDSLDNVSITMKVIDKVRNRIQNAKLATETGFQINIQSLETAWALADRNSSSNLVEWMNRLSNELIRQSPSSIIRSCAVLANTYRPLAEELFNIAFYCVWNELFSVQMGEVVMEAPLVSGIEMALQSPEIPKNIMISLLNLAEFMDVHDLPLPIDVRILARQAQSANMFAKCLRYREVEFQSKNLKPSLECVDALITVCNQLGLGDRAIGILRYLKFEFPDVDIQPQWLEKLCRWDEAFKAYEEQIHDLKNLHQGNYFPIKNDHCINMELGRLRCLHALGEYEDLLENAQYLRSQMKQSDDSLYWEATAEVQRLGSYAAWMLGKWESMEEFLEGEVRADDCRDVTLWNNVFFFKAVLAIHQQDYSRSLTLINDIRNSLSNGITALLSESYSRAYRAMVTMQILAEMEEVVEFKQMIDNSNAEHENLSDGDATAKFHSVKEKQLTLNSELTAKKIALIAKWRGRLKWAPKDIDVYRQILAVHTLVTEPLEDLDSWLELVTMCRKEAMQPLCANLLKKLGAPLPNKKSCAESNRDLTDLISKTNEKVLLSTYQYWWSNGEKEKALSELTSFLKSCPLPDSLSTIAHNYTSKDATMFRVRCLLKRATWMRELEKGDVAEILDTLREAQELAKDEYSVWHAWAVAHYDQLRKTGNDRKLSFDAESSSLPYIPVFISQTGNKNLVAPKHPGLSFKYSSSQKINSVQGSVSLLNLMSIQQTDQVTPYVVEAIKGFVRSIVLGQGQPLANLLQDTLRLLTLWFSYGTKKGALIILESELEKISSDNWLSVIPQLIARIHVKSAEISGLLRKILVKVASGHPQALVWPISVALNTNDGQQKIVATEILSEMKKNRRQLVEEVTMVSRELMKVAITPHELWYDGLEQAAQFYMDNKDIRSMVDTLVDLHETMNEPAWGESRKADPIVEGFTKIGSASIRDIAFRHSFGKYLQDGYFWLDQFRNSGRTVDLHQAWEIYQTMFKRIKGQISSLKRLELDHVSPALMNAKNLSLAVPGTYKPAESDTLITCFSAKVTVIASKQRPRRISMLGSDGRRYQFLLKGHEDLRQDERVMQLFGLINACLNYDRITNDRGLNVVRYSVLPLSNNSGLLEWVQSCDTMNQLIKQYREENDIKLLTEMRLLQSKSRSYDKLPLIQKVELFQQVLQETTGDDLAKILWLKSQTSDIWVERRANFTKSLAVMSMAGYILGLGDRHPSNLMIHRVSGHVVHIDFGDCFEITAHRSKYPEIIPFRLTRMLSNCMAAAGIQGSYRLTCERVMRVLRDNRDSVMAMLEAFVYDPLISWRLLGKGNDTEMKLVSHVNTVDEEFSGSQSAVDKLREQLSSGSDEKLPGLDHSIQNELSPKKSAIGSSLRDVPAVRRSKSQEGVVEDEPFQENVNARALEVINRIQSKLTGRDFLRIDEVAEDFSVEQQVDRLIKEATSIENLCQLFSEKMGNKLPKEQQPPQKTENVKPPPPPSNKPAHSGKASPVQNAKDSEDDVNSIHTTHHSPPSPASISNTNTVGDYSHFNQKLSISDFDLLKVLGKGSFGKVMLVRKKDDTNGTLYAMKTLRKAALLKRNQVAHTATERYILQNIHCPFLVHLVYAFQTTDKLYMVLDYMAGGELFFWLKKDRKFSENRSRLYAAEITVALEALHAADIVYRDLKPENILLDEAGHLRLTDFGLAKGGVTGSGAEGGTKTFCGTPEYLAPEILENKGHGKAVDWWALGTLLFEMLTGLPPFYDTNVQRMYHKILHEPLRFPKAEGRTVSEEAKDILRGLLERKVSSRLGSGPTDATELKRSRYFSVYEFARIAQKAYEAEFRPPTSASPTDVRNFDKEFTSEPAADSVVERGHMSETMKEKTKFEAFTFQGDNKL